jgi:hypothetical protein
VPGTAGQRRLMPGTRGWIGSVITQGRSFFAYFHVRHRIG